VVRISAADGSVGGDDASWRLLVRTGMFFQPAFPVEPALPLHDVIEECLATVEAIDELGFDEAWFGEHLSDPWEPVPAHDLVIAQALQRTSRITLCSGGFVVPYYHPASLAFRVMQLDHMAQGRYVCGLAAGISPVDLGLVGLDPAGNTHREMLAEALEIMLRIWTDHVGSEWRVDGKIWQIYNSPPVPPLGRPHIRPYQQPHPPVAISAVSPSSSTARLAGRHGMRVNSILLSDTHVGSHWDAYAEGAREEGIEPDRKNWSIVRDVFVAETDEEARGLALRSSASLFWRKTLDLAASAGWTKYVTDDPSVLEDAIDYEWLVDNHFLVGSPSTVLRRFERMYEATGGFGGLLLSKYQWREGAARDAERRSLELFQTKVAPGLPG
jgi:alkanesulfonate monooxygenase SsuD/methylene tetrahydromethanopterin reductase-like flavin-dependent oxidoreductase (luciferase family)